MVINRAMKISLYVSSFTQRKENGSRQNALKFFPDKLCYFILVSVFVSWYFHISSSGDMNYFSRHACFHYFMENVLVV